MNQVEKVMVNHSSNINKTNNHISLQFIEHKRDHDICRNPYSGLGQAQICGGVKPVNGMQPSPLHNWHSNGNANINKQTKYKQHRFASTPKYHTQSQT